MTKFINEIPEIDGYVFLASPYTSELHLVEATRYAFVRAAVAYLATAGITAISPVVYGHEVAHHHNIYGGDFWHTWALPIIKNCTEGWILMISGWQESEGVARELDLLRVLDKPTKFVYFNDSWTDLLVVENEHIV